MIKNFKVSACDRNKVLLGETVVDLPENVQEAIDLGYATSERDLCQQFASGVIVKIQNDLRIRARTQDEVKSVRRSSLAKAFLEQLHNGREQ